MHGIFQSASSYLGRVLGDGVALIRVDQDYDEATKRNTRTGTAFANVVARVTRRTITDRETGRKLVSENRTVLIAAGHYPAGIEPDTRHRLVLDRTELATLATRTPAELALAGLAILDFDVREIGGRPVRYIFEVEG